MARSSTTFTKGGSGNPKGRKPLTDAQRLARELKAQAQPDAVRALVKLLHQEDLEPRDRIAVAKALLEGLDAVAVEHSGEVRARLDLGKLDLAELDAMEALIAKAAATASE